MTTKPDLNLPTVLEPPSDESKTYFAILDNKLVEICVETGEIVSSTMPVLTTMRYTTKWRDYIAAMIVDGESLVSISKKEGHPSYSVLCQWRRFYPDFKEAIDNAKLDRAELLAEKALSIAEDPELIGDTRDDQKIELDRKKIVIDNLKWMAEKSDPAKYGKQTKITGDKNAPIAFTVLNTGIDRGDGTNGNI